jgi:glycosyltransferase involved in cell wall biosynthesis
MLFHGFYILSTEPLIVSYMASSSLYNGLANEVQKPGQEIPDFSLPTWFRPKYILEHIGGWSVPWHRMGRLKAKQIIHGLYGRSQHLIVNAPDEDITRKRFLVRGAQFSGSIYINEHLYNIVDEPKLYDAVYTAQLMPFKRHQLAKKIEKLMMISYGGDLPSFCPALKHADFNHEFLPRQELVKKYNQSYTGLCLSAVEGAMFASCEYLLCGIPVVSTPSKGGRDEFFTKENCIIVPPEPEAVALAVNQWKQHAPKPQQIRAQTLKQFDQLRRNYCVYIAKLIEQGGGGRQDPEKLMEIYFGAANGTTSRFVKLGDLEESKLEQFHLSNHK